MPIRLLLAGLCSLILAETAVAPGAAHAGVPRSCVDDTYDPLACARDTRKLHRKVLPSARLRVLDAQRQVLERVAPLEDAERNRLLREILDELRYGQR